DTVVWVALCEVAANLQRLLLRRECRLLVAEGLLRLSDEARHGGDVALPGCVAGIDFREAAAHLQALLEGLKRALCVVALKLQVPDAFQGKRHRPVPLRVALVRGGNAPIERERLLAG